MAAPRTANINIIIGDTEFVVKHSNFSSLSIDRTAKDVSDNFTLNIMDDDAYTIEGALLSGNNYIKITYIDDNLNVYKELGGYVISMSSSFIDNRCMLQLTGLVSNSIKDKYEKYSVPWNVVPKFDWGQVLGDSGVDLKDANYEYDSGLDQFFQGVGNFFSMSFTGWKSLFTWNWETIEDYTTVIDTLFSEDQFSIDAQGNYYVQKWIRDGDYSTEMTGEMDDEKEEDLIVKSDGSHVIPIKPHKLLKLICCGGYFSDLLEAEYIDYKGTAFYKSDLSEAEWYYIKKWYQKMGKFPGLGYKTFTASDETDWTEDEYIQTRQSFMEFMYDSVLPKCRITKDNKKYLNFYLSFEKNEVIFKRLDASKEPTNATEYFYYGKFNDDGKNKGRMTSFSPTLNILTSMITSGTHDSEGGDISGLNLITGKEGEGIKVSASESTEGRYNVTWGAIKIASTVNEIDTTNNEAALIKVFEEAAKLAYQAEATITGFNKLCPQDYINITILPKNDTGKPITHHMSGTYFIISIKDEISNGNYTSTLKLIKNIKNMGNTAAISTAMAEGDKEIKYKVVTDYEYVSNGNIVETQIAIGTGKDVMF